MKENRKTYQHNFFKRHPPIIVKRDLNSIKSDILDIIRETWDIRRTEMKMNGKRI
jgi:hypothetical protein